MMTEKYNLRQTGPQQVARRAHHCPDRIHARIGPGPMSTMTVVQLIS